MVDFLPLRAGKSLYEKTYVCQDESASVEISGPASVNAPFPRQKASPWSILNFRRTKGEERASGRIKRRKAGERVLGKEM